MRSRFILVIAVCLLLPFGSASAVNPDEVLEDAVLEQRARDLSINIRCLVCQNQSIDDSDAELARDLRVLVREKLVEGLSDDEILDFLVARYGEFVLLKPPVGTNTYLLWGLPFILLLMGGTILFVYSRRATKKSAEPVALSAEEKETLSRILDEK